MRLMALLLLVIASYGVSAQCSAPTGLSTSPITATAATAKWEPVNGALSYNLDYKLAGSPDWVTIANGTTSLQWTISGLTATTSYDWRVRANCSSGTSSYAQTQFTTQAVGSCTAPTGLYTSGITTSIATMNWSAVNGAFAYTVEYKQTSSSVWHVATSATYSTSYNLYGLSPSTSYDWRVYSNCSLSETSGYSGITQFTTPGSTPPPSSTCPGPYDISTNGTISGAAAISVNTPVNGTIAPKNDIDNYKFTITGYGTITVWLTTLPANYDLAVFNSNGIQIGISQNSGSKNEAISLVVNPGIYYAKVFPKGTATNAKSCYTLKVQTVTATGEMVTKAAATSTATMEEMKPGFSINLFPNPAGNQLNVWVDGVDKRPVIKVYNLMGKLVMQQGSSNILTQLDISKLPAGYYLVQVNDGKENRSARFVKQ